MNISLETISPELVFAKVREIINTCDLKEAQIADRMAKNFYRECVAKEFTISQLACVIGCLLHLLAKEMIAATVIPQEKNDQRQN